MNIILIGMPGCGKTTIGKMLSERLEIPFFDCDEEIEKKCGMTIPQMFEKFGEPRFRDEESAVIAELVKKTDAVVSTGGGCVERQCNIDTMKNGGTVVFINRSVDDIYGDVDISGRPLLAEGKERLRVLYERRIDMYKGGCDIEVANCGTLDETVGKIIDEVERYNA